MIPRHSSLKPLLVKNGNTEQINLSSGYKNEPAPMGIADYGIDPLTNRSYMYNTTCFLGTAAINSLNTTGGQYSGYADIQMNVVLKYQVGSIIQAEWLQDVVQFDTKDNHVQFLDNIWNLTDQLANNFRDPLSLSGNGQVTSDWWQGEQVYYYYDRPSDTLALPGDNVCLTYPCTILMQINSTTDAMGHPVASFSYDDGFGWQTYDQVTFFTVPGNVTNWNLVVDGTQYVTFGTLSAGIAYDAELELTGAGGGSTTTDINSDMNLSIDYFNGHNIEGIPCAYDYGSDTAETVSNVLVQPVHDGSGQLFNEIMAGSGALIGTRNSSATAIGNFVFSGQTSGTFAVGTAMYSFLGSSAQVTICPGTYPVYLNGAFIATHTFTAGLNTIIITGNKILPASGAPRNLTAMPRNCQVLLNWLAPASNGGSGIVNYKIYMGIKPGDKTWIVTIGNITTYLATGLTNGLMYYFEVSAVNGTGEGYPSNQVEALPMTVPAAPLNFRTSVGNGYITLYWMSPDDGGLPITNYTIYMGLAPGEEIFLETVGIGNVQSQGEGREYQCTGLLKGPTYYFKIAAVNSNGTGANSTERSAKAQTIPNAPTGLTLIVGNGRITLEWTAPTDNGGSPITNYTIYQGTWPQCETLLATVGNVTTYTVTNLTNGVTYYFQVSAVNAIGYGYRTSEANATFLGPPSKPQNLTASGGDTNATLTWDVPANHGLTPIEGYIIYCGTTSNAETYLITKGNVTISLVTGLINGQVYYFTVAAVNSIGPGPNATEVAVIPGGYPSAPQSFTATAGNAQIVLQWLAPVDDGNHNITGYDVYWGTTSSNETMLASLNITLTYTATNLTNGQHYFFKVTAVNSQGKGANSTEMSATPATVPDAPAGLTLTPGNTQVILNWVAPVWNGGSPIYEYHIFRSTTPGNEAEGSFVRVGLVLTYTWTGLPNGETFYFVVSACNLMGDSNFSTEASATPATKPGAPTAFVVYSYGNQFVYLTWTAPASNGGATVMNYTVYRGTTSGGETLLASGVTKLYYNSTGLTNGQIYYFRVAAVNAMGTGANATEVSATPATKPGAPTSFVLSSYGNMFVYLTWAGPANTGGSALTGYNVYFGTTSGGETLLASGVTKLYYNSTGLTNDQKYYFKVAAVNVMGAGANSTEVSATLRLPPIPSSTYVNVVPGNSFHYMVTNSYTLYSFFYGLNNGTYNFVLTVDNVTDNGRNTTIVYHGVFSNVTNSLIYTLNGSETIDGTDTVVTSIFTPAYSFLFFINQNIANKTYNSGLQTFYGALRLTNATWDNSGVITSMLSWQSGWGNIMSVQYSRVTTPTAPLAVSATARNGHVVLAWTVPASNGHSLITSYRIYCGTTPGSETFLINPGNVTMCNITGLTNSQRYYFIVQAVNAMGNGVNSTETILVYRLPLARFKVVSSTIYINRPVSFTDTSQCGDIMIVSWYWLFGDNSNATTQNATHEYAEPGVYTITLIVRDSNGLQSNATIIITVVAITSRQGLMGITTGLVIVLSAGVVVIVMKLRKQSLKRDWNNS